MKKWLCLLLAMLMLFSVGCGKKKASEKDDASSTTTTKGAFVKERGAYHQVQGLKVKAVDATAAGDTFCGALCVALAEGKSITEAVEFANRAAAVTVTRMGAQSSLPYRSEVKGK